MAPKQQQPLTHSMEPEHITFDPSWFKAMQVRGFSPADLSNELEKEAYAKYLRDLKGIPPAVPTGVPTGVPTTASTAISKYSLKGTLKEVQVISLGSKV